MGETDLANKCLDFCQTLSSRGSAFKFSLTMGSTFSFSLDTNVLTSDIQVKYVPKKKPSPSTIRRNARRREAFLNKKRSPAPSSLARPLQHPPKVPTPEKERLTDAIGDLHLTPVLGQGRVDVATHPSPPPSPSEPEGASSPCVALTVKVFRCRFNRCNETFTSIDEKWSREEKMSMSGRGYFGRLHNGPERNVEEEERSSLSHIKHAGKAKFSILLRD